MSLTTLKYYCPEFVYVRYVSKFADVYLNLITYLLTIENM